jgi:6-phosphogluconate dehydrogenase
VWNQGDLDSYLIEITRDIMAYKDTDGNHWWIKSWIQPARKAQVSGRVLLPLIWEYH